MIGGIVASCIGGVAGFRYYIHVDTHGYLLHEGKHCCPSCLGTSFEGREGGRIHCTTCDREIRR